MAFAYTHLSSSWWVLCQLYSPGCAYKREIGWVFEFDVLATSKVISGRVPTCDKVH